MYIVADIGGTKMRIARSDDLQAFQDPSIMPTPQEYQKGVDGFIETARSLAKGEKLDAVAIGFPGVFAPDKRTVLQSEHLPGWIGKRLAEDIEAALQTNVILENDTALVGLGETHFGAGKDSAILAYITVSTGVNGARIVSGEIDVSTYGFEIGGQYLSTDHEIGDLEDLISGSAIEKQYGKKPYEIEKGSVIWEELAKITALGVHNTVLHWSPDRVVLGGSMFNEIGIPVDHVQAHLAELLKKFPAVPDVVHSSLHDEGGLYGGLARLKQRR